MRLIVILACHDRRELTVRAISAAQAAAERAGAEVRYFLFDDGSSDGTADAVRDLGLPIEILQGDGGAFWARGMQQAERAALAAAQPDDLIVWLNDDVRLDEDAFARMLAVHAERPAAVLVGAVREPDGSAVSFSAYDRPGPHPLRLHAVQPTSTVRAVDTMNGNLVLVPGAVARRLGGMDGGFSHGLADIDYGLRVRAAGIELLLGAGTYGLCPGTPDRIYPRDYGTLRQAWTGFTGRKGGGNPRSLLRVLRRHAPRRWPVYFVWTYVVWWGRNLVRASRLRVAALLRR